MAEEKTFTLQEAHQHFALSLNNLVWELWEKRDRTPEDDEMTHAAHGSLYHWIQVGKTVNRQRGEWMIAKCYMHRKLTVEALCHAQRCFEWTKNHAGEIQDFDVAFAYELLARVHALSGKRTDAEAFLTKAQAAGKAIKDDEDRKEFERQFNAEPWYGLRS